MRQLGKPCARLCIGRDERAGTIEEHDARPVVADDPLRGFRGARTNTERFAKGSGQASHQAGLLLIERGPAAATQEGDRGSRTLPDAKHSPQFVVHAGRVKDLVLVESLRPDADEPVSPGEVGELTYTNLVGDTQTLLRYRTGDLGVLSDGSACACGSTPCADRRLHPRSSRRPDGRNRTNADRGCEQPVGMTLRSAGQRLIRQAHPKASSGSNSSCTCCAIPAGSAGASTSWWDSAAASPSGARRRTSTPRP